MLWRAVPTSALVSCQQTANQMLSGQKAELSLSEEQQSCYQVEKKEICLSNSVLLRQILCLKQHENGSRGGGYESQWLELLTAKHSVFENYTVALSKAREERRCCFWTGGRHEVSREKSTHMDPTHPKRKCVKAHMSESVLVRARLSVSGCSEKRGAMRDRSDEKLGFREDL